MASVGLTIEYAVGWDAANPNALETLALGFERAGIEASKWGRYLFPHLMPVFEAAAVEQFDAEGQGPAEGKWPALSERYAKAKAKRWPGRPILVASGALRAALATGGAQGLREVTEKTMAYGTRGLIYASFHQTGTPNMPARPEVDFGPGVAAAIREAAADALRELVAVAGLERLLEGPMGPLTEEASMLGPMTKRQASAAKGKATRIKKLQALRKKREGK